MKIIHLNELWNFTTEGEDIFCCEVETVFCFLIRHDDEYELWTADGRLVCYGGDSVWVVKEYDDKVCLKAYEEDEDNTFYISKEEYNACIEDTGD